MPLREVPGAVAALVFQQVPQVVVAEYPEQPAAAGSEPGHLEIDERGQALGGDEQVGLLREVVVYHAMRMQSAQEPRCMAEVAGVPRLCTVHRRTFDPRSGQPVAIRANERRHAIEPVERSQCPGLAAQQSAREPAQGEGGGRGVAHDLPGRTGGFEPDFTEQVLFKKP